ncbi:MAG: hypothetical protein OXE96_16415 [Gemmatimonadetes bacterium]|nr:hypothetical protein [Gemmatimonadota bacterium]
MQELLFRHADCLPLGEIDPAYEDAVPICMELGTRAGSVDALYLTPTGKVILAEFKLWKNPDARREVIGQILDYARVLASWTYDDLEREVRQCTARSPFDMVSEAHSDMQEQLFVDRVARNLKCGEFLLLIIGDGIREGVEDIVSYVQEHSGLRFNLALVEAAIFRRGDSGEGDVIIQPRVLAQTELVPRTILVRKTVLEETDEDPIEEHEPTPVEDENERFWMAVLRDFAFDDTKSETPVPSGYSYIWVKVEGSGHGGWGLSLMAFLDRNKRTMGAYLSRRKGEPEAERVFDEIIRALRADMQLEDDEQQEIGLHGWQEWSSQGRPRLGFWRKAEFTDGAAIQDFDESVEWVRERFNRLVSRLYPECRRRLRAEG